MFHRIFKCSLLIVAIKILDDVIGCFWDIPDLHSFLDLYLAEALHADSLQSAALVIGFLTGGLVGLGTALMLGLILVMLMEILEENPCRHHK